MSFVYFSSRHNIFSWCQKEWVLISEEGANIRGNSVFSNTTTIGQNRVAVNDNFIGYGSMNAGLILLLCMCIYSSEGCTFVL